MGKKPDGSLGDFSVAVSFPAHHKTDTIGMGISPSGKFIASCNDKTELIIWSLKGDILEKIGQSQVFSFNFIFLFSLFRHRAQPHLLLPGVA